MNKTLIFSIIGGIIVIGLLVLVYQLTSPASSSLPADLSATTHGVGLPSASSITQSTTGGGSTDDSSLGAGTTMSVTGISGEVFQTSNFMTDPVTVKDPINPGYYYLGYHSYEGVPDPTATATPPYVIEYIASTQYFNIALLQEPIGEERGEAEQYLMAHLGIPQNQMCQLNYTISVPDRVNSQYAGKNLGFSFCPGATVLPQ